MKVTIFIGSLSTGGAERTCCNIANYLLKSKHEVSFLLMSDVKADYQVDEKVNIVHLIEKRERKNFIYNAFLRYKRLFSYIKNNEVDVYIVMLPITILLISSLRRFIKGKIVVSERNMPTLYPKWQQFAMKLIAKIPNGWVFQTKEQFDWYKKFLTKKQKITIIPNAINCQFADRFSTDLSKKWIVNVGRLSPQKNQDLLIRAFSNISKIHPECSLHIFGDGPLKKELEMLGRNLGVSSKVYFEGFVKDIAVALINSSCFVLSSNYEGMPNALIEAMALGIPCISTDCCGGGPKFLIENEVNGLLVPPKDEKSLTDAINKVLSDSKFAKRLGENSKKIREKLCPDKIYGMWENFIKFV